MLPSRIVTSGATPPHRAGTWPCAAGDYRVDALYFAVAVFSTVGFGDIGAVTELAWIPRDDSDDPGPDLLRRGSAATNRGS
ncbi:ion channel [Microbacterium sp. DT81.1]|uniref:ion channel n=1 Tax=Microbacterium sp. DT81.1 TaxID=3393413 RepID=UPI003CF9DD1B